ncbi:hypothetical protein MUK42_32874, partial [Musa troglodytarum]
TRIRQRNSPASPRKRDQGTVRSASSPPYPNDGDVFLPIRKQQRRISLPFPLSSPRDQHQVVLLFHLIAKYPSYCSSLTLGLVSCW